MAGRHGMTEHDCLRLADSERGRVCKSRCAGVHGLGAGRRKGRRTGNQWRLSHSASGLHPIAGPIARGRPGPDSIDHVVFVMVNLSDERKRLALVRPNYYNNYLENARERSVIKPVQYVREMGGTAGLGDGTQA